MRSHKELRTKKALLYTQSLQERANTNSNDLKDLVTSQRFFPLKFIQLSVSFQFWNVSLA